MIAKRDATLGPAAAGADRYRKVRQRRIGLVLLATDVAMVVLAGLLATFVRYSAMAAMYGEGRLGVKYLLLSLAAGLVLPLFLHGEHLYDVNSLFRGSGEFTRVARAVSGGILASLILTYLVDLPGLSRSWAIVTWLGAIALVWFGRASVRLVLTAGHWEGRCATPTLIVGSNAEALKTIETLRRDPASGLIPFGVLSSPDEDEEFRLKLAEQGVPIIGLARHLREIVLNQPVSAVIIVASAFNRDIVARMVVELRDVPVDINVSAGLFDVVTGRVLVREVAGVPFINVRGVFFSKWAMFKKRAFDVTIASAILAAGMPLWLAIMALIKLDSRGPIFYKQPRVGRFGEHFHMLKFRSMCVDAEAKLAELQKLNEASGPLFKVKHDPRVTRVGKWLRKFSLDEFPQLINVVCGEMSLVGPRPPLPREAEQYGEFEWRRMEVLPGLTGLWQVSGRSNLSFEEMIRLDLYYIENWFVLLDLSILFRTVPAVVFAKGAY